MDSYAPLVDFWAARGFVVIEPTHLDSRTLDLAPDDPRTPSIWRIRIDDVTVVLDRLDAIEAAVPGLAGASTTTASRSPAIRGRANREHACGRPGRRRRRRTRPEHGRPTRQGSGAARPHRHRRA